MVFRYLRHAAFVATLLHHTIAQQSKTVPQDLQGGFVSQGIEMQVSYTNEAVNGFRDGTSFDKNAVTKEPTFALGDSSGISPTTLHTIIMLDTTCPNKRILHYARANFKLSQITNIDTESAALLNYKAPGSFGETGDDRQYSFLMYINPQRKQIDSLKLPAEGEAFDVEKFQTDNGLPDAFAGVGMVVKLGGQADCGGNQPSGVPSAKPPLRSSTTSAAPASSAAATISSSRVAPTTPVAATSSSTRIAPTSTSARQPASSAANTAPTPTPPTSSAPSNSNNNPGDNNDNNDNTIAPSDTPNVPSPSAEPTSGPVIASGVAPSNGLVTSTVVAGSNGAVGASGTLSASPAEQSTNSAPGLSFNGYGSLAPLFAVVGLLVW